MFETSRNTSRNNGIANSTKTAISVEDTLMAQADDFARNLGLSRSALIAEALRDYLKLKRRQQITEQLNQAYENGPTPEERSLVENMRTNFRPSDRW